jgi:hypothetical protein
MFNKCIQNDFEMLQNDMLGMFISAVYTPYDEMIGTEMYDMRKVALNWIGISGSSSLSKIFVHP